jgi:hypothetical protein
MMTTLATLVVEEGGSWSEASKGKCMWLMPVILATQEVDIKRTEV